MKFLILMAALLAAMGATESVVPVNLLEGQTWESGYLSVGRPGDKLFYILLRTSNATIANPPLVVWLNGGPGCSSMLGLFQENGPFIVDKDKYFFKKNPYTWNVIADMIYVDQPLQVGFSVSESDETMCKNETCVGFSFYAFLTKLVELHPEYKGRALYLTGESYAGRYIPTIAAYLVKARNPDINLKGAAIGNPSTDRMIQMSSYPYYLYENDKISFINYLLLRQGAYLCQVGIKLGLAFVNNYCALGSLHLAHIINPYDIRENKTYDPIDAQVELALNRTDVQKLLGAEKKSFISCNETINDIMGAEWTLSQRGDVEYLLNNNFTLMLYYGDRDAQCNWRGGEWMSNSFEWYGQEQFNAVEHKGWMLEGKQAGTYRKYRNFMFLRIHNSGHMVPLDLPEISLEMFRQFLGSEFN